VCFVSKIARQGSWAMPRTLRVAAIMGEAVIDLTRVQIGPGTSVIEVLSVMANVRVIVPHGLRVECTGTPVMGTFTLARASDAVPAPEAPLVRITGTSIMSEVRVKVIDPASPGRFAAWLKRRRAQLSRPR
jgi:predicted membrane protein